MSESVRPYPERWETKEKLADGSEVFIRPIKPEDERLYEEFAQRLTPEDIRLRLFAPVHELSHQFLARLTQIDYAREMALIALRRAGNEDELVGVVRLVADPDYEKAEYGVLVRSDLKGIGLGWALMCHLIRYAKSEGWKVLYGLVLNENLPMIQMCRELGFKVEADADDRSVWIVTLDLNSAPIAD